MGKRQKKLEEEQKWLQQMTETTIDWGWSVGAERAIARDVLLALNRLAGAGTRDQGTAEATAIIDMLSTLLGGSADHRDYLTAMMSDLNRYANATGLWQGAARAQPTPSERAAASARRLDDFEATYEIRRRDREDYLVETREGSKGKNFQVCKSDYDAATAAITQPSEDGLTFAELRRLYREAGGQGPDYRLRVVLRFWRLCRPPIITKAEGRYRVIDAKHDRFRQRGVDAWRRLESDSADRKRPPQ